MSVIPAAALQQHTAVVAKTGAGKSYLMKGVVEGLLDDGERVCVADPTGAWWGLRSGPTGKSGGYPVVVFGGDHADMPLGASHGAALAEIIGTTSTPAILDTSLMTVGERTRFWAAFAEALLRKNRGPLHLVIDEAHVFAPQGKVMDPQSGAMLHATNNLLAMGRSRGLRITLVSQRPAKIHKDALTQVETLVALRLIAPQDRKAVEEWISDNADKAKAKEIMSSLATLPTGEGWIWAPELGVLERFKAPKIKTFDSGRAPTGAADKAVLAPINRDAIAKQLEAIAVDVVENDPKRLQEEIAKLKKQLAAKSPAAPDEKALAAARAAARVEGHREGYEEGVRSGETTGRKGALGQALDALQRLLGDKAERPAAEASDRGSPARPRVVAATVMVAKPDAGYMRRETRTATNGNGAGSDDLPAGERSCLIGIAQYPNGVTREQLTVLTSYKRSTRDKYIYLLRNRGLVDQIGERVVATQAGIDALGCDYDPLPTGDELRARVLRELPEGERRVLEVAIGAYPETVSRDAIDDASGFKRSTRDKYIYLLSRRELVETVGRGEVRASANLFD
jgi:hypothetical protein